ARGGGSQCNPRGKRPRFASTPNRRHIQHPRCPQHRSSLAPPTAGDARRRAAARIETRPDHKAESSTGKSGLSNPNPPFPSARSRPPTRTLLRTIPTIRKEETLRASRSPETNFLSPNYQPVGAFPYLCPNICDICAKDTRQYIYIRRAYLI